MHSLEKNVLAVWNQIKVHRTNLYFYQVLWHTLSKRLDTLKQQKLSETDTENNKFE